MASAVGCVPPAQPLGSRCLFSDDCAPDLLCVGGYCRAECRTTRDCVNAWQCLGSGYPNKKACLPPGELGYCVYTSDCSESPPLSCGFDGVCRHECQDDADCVVFDPQLRCVANQCLWPVERDGGARD